MAKFNRDFLTACTSHPKVARVVAIPRVASSEIHNVPANIDFIQDGLAGKIQYIRAINAVLHASRKPDGEPKLKAVICGHIGLLPLAFACAKYCSIPLALIVHGIEAWRPNRRYIANLLIRKVHRILSVSETTKKRLLSWSKVDPRHISIVPNCVDLQLFGSGPKDASLMNRYGLNGRRIIMTMGRLASCERYKGVDEVIELLPKLLEKVPDIAYMVVGDGGDRERLEKKVARARLGKYVVFTGAVREDEKAAHYRLADAYVMPSRGEGFGIVYLEALACGVPVVGSKLDGSREALRDGQLGILVDPSNSDEILHGVLEAIERPNGVPAGLDYFSSQNFEKRVHEFISELLR